MAEENIKGTIITLFSTASAVGKTLVGCNLASEIAAQGARVCLVDLDLQFGDVCNYLKLTPRVTIADAQQSMNVQGSSLDVRDFLTPYMHGTTTFHVMAAPTKLEDAYNMSPKTIKEILQKLQTSFDYLIVDTTSMFSVVNLSLMDLSTIVMFLGIVDFIPTIKNMKIGSDTLKSLNYDKQKIRIILNRSDAKTRIGFNDVEKLMGAHFDFVLPNDFAAASKSIQTGVPLVLERTASNLGDSLKVLVSRYTNKALRTTANDDYGDGEKGGGWFSRLFG